jgi:hypothetical protein
LLRADENLEDVDEDADDTGDTDDTDDTDDADDADEDLELGAEKDELCDVDASLRVKYFFCLLRCLLLFAIFHADFIFI